MGTPLKINDLSRHHESMQGELAAAAAEVLQSGWFVLGRQVEAFEKAFAEFCGTRFAVGVGNGTDALEISLRALDVGAGDEVVTVANAGLYASTAILSVGASPVFADVDPLSMTMDPVSLEASISPRCKALVVTHLYGRLANVDAILRIAATRGVPVVEDCAQAHGASEHGRRAGSLGVLGCFSFYPTKNLGACGDGGGITTSDAQLAERIRRLRQYGWSQKYTSTQPYGRNSRLDELQAAFLLRKLPKLPAWNARRRAIASRYGQLIRNPLVGTPLVEGENHVAHLYVVRARERDSLRDHLGREGISSDVHYPIPDYRQPALASRFENIRLPVTELLAREVLTLPCFPEMSDDEAGRVAAACNSWKP